MATERKREEKRDIEAEMEVYKKLGTPGEAHKLLSRMAGTWNTLTRSWMEPGKPPEESAGVCEQRMVLGGHYLQQECTGEMMGTQFTGIGFTGYDNHTRKFVSTWMDSTSTAIWYFEGPIEADGKSFTQKSRYDDPVRGPMEWRSVCRLQDDNTMSFEMYGTVLGGQEEKMMEMKYTRKQ
ncbi:MAG: hypothetical protein A2052_09510 [Deltaproteobacteria bacterium GWA2_54_12]|nr:MAG: hypothetical protein A2052_09510 [Deltaproteobacteria bacterium GWA2_54_12]